MIRQGRLNARDARTCSGQGHQEKLCLDPVKIAICRPKDYEHNDILKIDRTVTSVLGT